MNTNLVLGIKFMIYSLSSMMFLYSAYIFEYQSGSSIKLYLSIGLKYFAKDCIT